jgi:hypothetical protein
VTFHTENAAARPQESESPTKLSPPKLASMTNAG